MVFLIASRRCPLSNLTAALGFMTSFPISKHPARLVSLENSRLLEMIRPVA